MYFIVPLLCLLKVVVACDYPYSVTILNDASVTDNQGLVHTWLKFKGQQPDKFFSFEGVYMGNIIGGVDVPGKCTPTQEVETKRPSELVEICITESQYDKLIAASDTFCASDNIYDLTPNNLKDDFDVKILDRPYREDFNCVTAANKILQAGHVDVLGSAKTPYDVKGIINNSSNIFERVAAGVFTAFRRFLYVFNDAGEHGHPW